MRSVDHFTFVDPPWPDIGLFWTLLLAVAIVAILLALKAGMQRSSERERERQRRRGLR